jgi:hypothetical protein
MGLEEAPEADGGAMPGNQKLDALSRDAPLGPARVAGEVHPRLWRD